MQKRKVTFPSSLLPFPFCTHMQSYAPPSFFSQRGRCVDVGSLPPVPSSAVEEGFLNPHETHPFLLRFFLVVWNPLRGVEVVS